MQRNKISKFTALAFGAALVGCQTDKSSMTDFFPPEEEQAVRTPFEVQAASGARADASLQPFHFDGEKLNSLGEAKLDLMLKDDYAAQPLVVYLNVPEKESVYNLRRDAVTRYLEDRGVVNEQIKFVAGPNPNARSLAATHLSRISRTENTSAGGESGGGSAAPADMAPGAPAPAKEREVFNWTIYALSFRVETARRAAVTARAPAAVGLATLRCGFFVFLPIPIP